MLRKQNHQNVGIVTHYCSFELNFQSNRTPTRLVFWSKNLSIFRLLEIRNAFDIELGIRLNQYLDLILN